MLRPAWIAFCMCVCVQTEELVSLLQTNRLTIDNSQSTLVMNGVGPSACTRDTPETMRHASSIWAAQGDVIGVGHGRGRLDSPQAWSTQHNKIGEWYQMDNGVVGEITGVAIKGRHDNDQWVRTFKVMSNYPGGGTWKDVDSGKVYTGNMDRDTQVDVTFDTPVHAQYIRIYPQTWRYHMSLRADIMVKCAVASPLPCGAENARLKAANALLHSEADGSWAALLKNADEIARLKAENALLHSEADGSWAALLKNADEIARLKAENAALR